jgi:Tol biopolymer transport system component
MGAVKMPGSDEALATSVAQTWFPDRRLLIGLCVGLAALLAGCQSEPVPPVRPTSVTTSVAALATTGLPPYPALPVLPSMTPFPAGYVPPPSMTPFPTDTAGPSPTPTQSPSPTVTPGPVTTLGYDLLYLRSVNTNNSELWRWNHRSGQSEVLVAVSSDPVRPAPGGRSAPSNVTQYSVSADGQHVALSLVRIKAQGANGLLVYELALQNLPSSQLISLATFEMPLLDTQISPDGQWVAYVEQGPKPGAVTGLAALAEPPGGGGPIYGVLHIMRIAAPQQPLALGLCSDYCFGFSWAPDSQALVWNDGRGVWLDRLVQGNVQMIATDVYAKVSNEAPATTWSPDGRYLLAWSRDTQAGGWGVLDTQTTRFSQLPGSHVDPSDIQALWLRDGRLFVLQSGDGAQAELWHMDPSSAEWLVLDKAMPIAADPQAVPFAPAELGDQRLAFILATADPVQAAESGLYVIDLKDDGLKQVSTLATMFTASDVNAFANGSGAEGWSPDGKGAYVLNQFVPVQDVLLASAPADYGDDFMWIP